MLGEIVYEHNGYIELVVSEQKDCRVVGCYENSITKMYRVEKLGVTNRAEYDLSQALYKQSEFSGLYEVPQYLSDEQVHHILQER